MARTRKQGGTVRRLPSGRWQAQVKIDGRHRSTGGTFATEAEALAALRQAAADVDAGRPAKPIRGVPLFADFAAHEVRVRDVRPRTRRGYETLLRSELLPHFGPLRLDAITVGHVRGWWSARSAQPVNRRNAYFLLRSVLGAAVEDGLIDSSPVRIKNAGKDVAEPRPTFDVDDFEAVLAEMPTDMRPVVEMIFASHCRLGEVIGLTAGDYNPTTGLLSVTKSDTGPTKTGQHKQLRILGRGVRAMNDYLADQPRIGNAPLFVGPKGGRLPRATLRKAWNEACAAAGIENFHLHDLRHIGLTLVAQSGASLRDVQHRGGHASVQAAMRYQHATVDRDAEVAAMVDRRLDGLGS